MHFIHASKSFLGTKSAITMSPASKESTLLLFLLILTFLVVPNPSMKQFLTKISLYLAMQDTCTIIIALVKNSFQLTKVVENQIMLTGFSACNDFDIAFLIGKLVTTKTRIWSVTIS